MPDISYPPPRPLSVGEVLDLSFRIYRATFVKCLLFGAASVIGNWLPRLYAASMGQGALQVIVAPKPDTTQKVLLVIGGLVSIVFSMAILKRQHLMATGSPIGGEVAVAIRRVPRMILFGILFSLIALACGLFIVPAFFTRGLARVALIAVLLLPLAYVVIRLSCAYTSLVVSDTGAVESLERSWRLTRGSFWRLTVIYTVAFILLLALYLISGSLTAFLYGVLGRGDVAMVMAAVAVVIVLVGALGAPLFTALGLAVLGDLSVRKEGADLAQRIAAS
jgi:hypothetical protein